MQKFFTNYFTFRSQFRNAYLVRKSRIFHKKSYCFSNWYFVRCLKIRTKYSFKKWWWFSLDCWNCKKLWISKAHFVGRSFWAGYLANFAIKNPEKVESLTLLEPAIALNALIWVWQSEDENFQKSDVIIWVKNLYEYTGIKIFVNWGLRNNRLLICVLCNNTWSRLK